MHGKSITAVNVAARTALANDDTLCVITNLFDVDGDETEDENAALTAVVRYDDSHWFAVKLSDFEKASN